MRLIAIAQVCAVVCAVACPPAAAQDLQSVRAAVATGFGQAEEDEAAVARLVAWGDAALPFLDAMISDADLGDDYHALEAIGAIRTEAAVDLLLDAIERSPSPVSFSAVIVFRWTFREEPSRSLYDTVRARAVLAEYLESSAGWTVGLTTAMEAIAEMGWTDLAPRVEPLLEHRDRDVRLVAAETIEALTGERPAVADLELRFPAVHREPGVLDGPLTLPYRTTFTGPIAFARWSDSRDCLLFFRRDADGFVLERLDEELLLTPALRLEEILVQFDVLPSDEHGLQLVGRTWARGRQRKPSLIGLAPDGSLLWEHAVDDFSIRGFVTLHRAGAPIGIAVGRGFNGGVFALSLDGEPIWSHESVHARSLGTHRGVDDLLVMGTRDEEQYTSLGRRVRDRDEGGLGGFLARMGRGLSELGSEGPPSRFPSALVLFPVESGGHATIAAGTDSDSAPMLWRSDDRGRVEWTAQLDEEVAALCLVEPAAEESFVAVLTHAGDFRAVRLDGTLFHERLGILDPDDDLEGKPRLHAVHMSAGPLGGRTKIAISARGRLLLFDAEG